MARGLGHAAGALPGRSRRQGGAAHPPHRAGGRGAARRPPGRSSSWCPITPSGVDNIDVAACTRRGVMVTNTPDVLTESTADMAWALLMAAARRVAEGDRVLRAGGSWRWGPEFMLGQDVFGKTLGIIGFGRIGRAVARRAVGFGMKVLFHHPSVAAGTIDAGAESATLDDLLARSDFVSLHVPLDARDPSHDLRRAARPDETDGGARQHGPRPGARRGGAGRGARRRASSSPPASMSTSTSPKSSPACSLTNASCWLPISGAPRSRPAPPWACWRRTTSSPPCGASARRRS